MKIIAVLLFCASSWSWACPQGTLEWKETCAAMPKALSQTVDSSKWVSEEKPSHHPQPAWQRGEVKAVDAPSMIADDEKLDQERIRADADGQANCVKQFGKDACGPDTGKQPT